MPGQRDRHHEQCRQRQVGREHPLRQVQVLRLDVFDHRDVKLSRQADNGHHCHAGLHDHRRPVDRVLPVFFKTRREFGLIEQIIEAVIQTERDEHADRHKREQLDQRFKGDGQNHAAVMFGDVQVTRTEDDGEQRQNQRHHQRRILGAGAGGVRHRTDQNIHAQHDAFQLQGDVRQHADQADQRHHHRQ